MTRIAETFARLAHDRRCGVIPYLTCGDPDAETTVEIALRLAEEGADFLELGVPFSDPIADGPVIQSASQRALANGTTVRTVISCGSRIRQKSAIPLVLFSYLNPLLRYGMEELARDCAAAGFDAVLVTDLPPEASEHVAAAFRSAGLSMAYLASPTTSDARLELIARHSDAFVYYVSSLGVTGVRDGLDPRLGERVRNVRGRVGRPLVVGFGISTPEQVHAIAPHADAVVVGSAIMRAIEGEAEGAADRAAAMMAFIMGKRPADADSLL